VSDDLVKMTAKRIDGSVLDVCGFGHKSGWDCDGTGDKPAAITSPPASTTAAPSAPASSSRCGCGAGGRAGGLAPYGALGLGLILALRRRFRYPRR
jgi:MYXO-CTERM domain-containing protein